MGQRRHYIASDPGPKTGAAIQQAMAATGDPQAMAQLRAMAQEMGQRLNTVEATAHSLESTAAELEPIKHASAAEHARLQAGIDAANARVFNLETDQSRQDLQSADLAVGLEQARNAAQSAGETAVAANNRAVTATTTAAEAKTAAQQAATDAASASTAAANAGATATQAKATADTAATTAAAAKTASDQATSTATTAQQTANTAKTTADAAATAAAAANTAAQQALTRQVRSAYALVSVPILLLGASAPNQTINWSPGFPNTAYSWTIADNAGLLARVTVSEVSRTATSITVKVTAGLLAVTVAGSLTLTAAMLV